MLYKAKVAASEPYNTALEQQLRDALGVRFAERARHRPGASGRSARSSASTRCSTSAGPAARRTIDDRRGELAGGSRPTTAARRPRSRRWQLAQQATLETRDAKHAPRSEAEQRSAWRDEAAAVLGAR